MQIKYFRKSEILYQTCLISLFPFLELINEFYGSKDVRKLNGILSELISKVAPPTVLNLKSKQ